EKSRNSALFLFQKCLRPEIAIGKKKKNRAEIPEIYHMHLHSFLPVKKEKIEQTDETAIQQQGSRGTEKRAARL
ncbi:MAG: hypothetical protein LUH20_04970, partial [Lachnospiraceae bacterium]|nr:hypothetical protein [Lachnospiraceae bacterium]